MTLRAAAIAFALALVGAAPASAVAADVSVEVAPEAGVRLGDALDVTGQVTESGTPLGGRQVELEVRRYPYTRAWQRSGTATTDAAGRFRFRPELDRNHRVRVRLLPAIVTTGEPPATTTLPGALSPAVVAHVLPAFTLSFKQRGRESIRITQVYTVPRDVKLSAPTAFYVGRRGARRAPRRATAETRRVRAGRYIARTTVKIPARFKGRFSYVSCFAYSTRSGMGDPGAGCPRRSVKISRTG